MLRLTEPRSAARGSATRFAADRSRILRVGKPRSGGNVKMRPCQGRPYFYYCAPTGRPATLAARKMAERKFNALPGFGLTFGFTLLYLSAIVLIPVAGLFLRALEISWIEFWRLATTARALAAYKLTFGASLVAAL